MYNITITKNDLLEYMQEVEKQAFTKQVKAKGNDQTEKANKDFIIVHKIMNIIKNTEVEKWAL